MFLQMAYQLQRAHQVGGGLPAQLHMWEDMCMHSGLVAEQLVYVAALAVDAEVVYCDRPKAETYVWCVGGLWCLGVCCVVYE